MYGEQNAAWEAHEVVRLNFGWTSGSERASSTFKLLSQRANDAGLRFQDSPNFVENHAN